MSPRGSISIRSWASGWRDSRQRCGGLGPTPDDRTRRAVASIYGWPLEVDESWVGYIDGAYVLNPAQTDMPDSDLDLVVAGTADGVLMVESEASELSEEVMLGAVTFGHEQMQPVIQAIVELAESCAREPWPVELVPTAWTSRCSASYWNDWVSEG